MNDLKAFIKSVYLFFKINVFNSFCLIFCLKKINHIAKFHNMKFVFCKDIRNLICKF